MKRPPFKTLTYLAAIALTLSFNACTLYGITSEETADSFYAPKASGAEVQYIENVNRPNDVIGSVTVNAERNQKMSAVLDRLKYEAAQIGADAITNIQTNGGDGKWARIKPQALFGNSNVRANFVADAVVFK